MSTPVQETTNQQVEIDLDSWLGTPGSENILIPEEKSKPNVFSNPTSDLNFLDGDEEETEETEETTEEEDKSVAGLDDILNPGEEEEEEKEEATKPKGRPKTEKSGLIEFFKKRIESKEMFTFDDFDEEKQTLDEYLGSLSEKDLDELYTANLDNVKSEIASSTPKEFFESLPQELQYAAKYVADGGQNLKELFSALSQVEHTKELDVEDETDQEVIIRQYLSATGFGDEDEISEEIETWKDLNILGKKANQFKPKLDKMQESIVAKQIQEQEERKLQQEEAAKEYVGNVFEALRTGEVNGLKLDKNTQARLYAGLTQANYPSVTGRKTNQLGHLLEKYQYVEPNHALIAEALWLLSSPEEYRKNIALSGKNSATEEIVRGLKTEQASKKTSATGVKQEEEKIKTKKIARTTPSPNFFKR